VPTTFVGAPGLVAVAGTGAAAAGVSVTAGAAGAADEIDQELAPAT
jgi:hypothetical protein